MSVARFNGGQYRLLPQLAEQERPAHPKYGRALGGAPRLCLGVVLYPFRRSITDNVWATPDGAIEIDMPLYRRTYRVWAADRYAPQRPRRFDTSVRLALRMQEEVRADGH
jgi:hypothetical protein